MTIRLLAALLPYVRLTLVVALLIGTCYFWQKDRRRCRPYLYTLCTFLVVYAMDVLRFFAWWITWSEQDYLTVRAFLAIGSLSAAYWTLLTQDLAMAPPHRGTMRLRKGWMLLLGMSLALLAGCYEQERKGDAPQQPEIHLGHPRDAKIPGFDFDHQQTVGVMPDNPLDIMGGQIGFDARIIVQQRAREWMIAMEDQSVCLAMFRISLDLGTTEFKG